MLKSRVMTSTHPSAGTILRGQCLNHVCERVPRPSASIILRGRCLRGWYPLCAKSKYYPKRTMLKRMCDPLCTHPSTILRGRCLNQDDRVHCAPFKYYPKRTMLKRMIGSTVHHPNTILRGRCLNQDVYPLCTTQVQARCLRGQCLSTVWEGPPSKYYYPKRTMLKRMIGSTVHHPSTILRGRCLRSRDDIHCAPSASTIVRGRCLNHDDIPLHHPNIILRGQCLNHVRMRVPVPHASIILRGRCLNHVMMSGSTVQHPSTILRGRCLRGWEGPLCTKCKYYPKRTMPKSRVMRGSTVHHPSTILRGRCLRRWYSNVHQVQVLS